MLRGVPNTAFTEAFAFVFQERDLDVLGIKREEDPNRKHLKALEELWKTYEIMGVSLVDMKAWSWLYKNPDATPEELKEAVTSIAKEVWNKYYADVFEIKDQSILAIYSHMIDSALYLPDYPLGHVIAFQVRNYLEGKNLGEEMERMCAEGKIIPQEWMKNAVGAKISSQPLLDAVDEGFKHLK
jgi:oligoendopeptidase F